MDCDEFEDLVCGIVVVREVEVEVEVVFAVRLGRVHSGNIAVFDERRVLVGRGRLKH